MEQNTAEIVEELDVAEEEQVSDEELMAALEEELAAVEPEAEAEEEEPEPVAEPEATDEPPAPTDEEPDAAADKEPEPEEKAEEPKPEEPKVEAVKEEKPSDEFGTLEDSVPEKTRERFEAIKSKYDAIAQERDSVKAEADKWVEAVTSTGTNPEQFGMALTWLKKVNSRDPKELEDAYQIMLNEVQVLGKTLGKPLPGVYDPLDDYPDLKGKVDDGLMDDAAAQEVAQARAMRKLSESSRETEQQSAQEKQIYDNTMAEVRQFGAELQQSDPYFNQKMQYLEPIITAAVSSGAPPQNWLKIIKGAYEKLPNPVATAPTPPKPHVPDPIRPGGTTPATNSMEKEPGNELEALNQALARGW
jgi:hypothetical protein